jgi:putative addiction module component (TIGR02574 family)
VEPSFEQMSAAERIEYLQDLWDRIAEQPEAVPVPEAQLAELRRRVDEHRADPASAIPWEQVLASARNR